MTTTTNIEADENFGPEDIHHGDLIKTEHDGQLGMTNENQYYVKQTLPNGIYLMSHGQVGYDSVVEVIPYPELSETKKPVGFSPSKRERELKDESSQ